MDKTFITDKKFLTHIHIGQEKFDCYEKLYLGIKGSGFSNTNYIPSELIQHVDHNRFDRLCSFFFLPSYPKSSAKSIFWCTIIFIIFHYVF